MVVGRAGDTKAIRSFTLRVIERDDIHKKTVFSNSSTDSKDFRKKSFSKKTESC